MATPTSRRRSRIARSVLIPLLAIAPLACMTDDMETMETARASTAPIATAAEQPIEDAIRQLAVRRVYFGHQSVGGNLMSGVREILKDHADVGLRIVESRAPAAVSGPAFMHFAIGTNEDPDSKNADFVKVLDARPTRDSAIVLMKYCYIDVNAATDIDSVFRGYRTLVAEVKARHPDVTFVHVTMPLTVDAAGPKAAIKRVLGRTTARELNQKRSRFNSLLREEFAGEPIFDLAALEATRTDGSTERVTVDGEPVFALSSAYTTDGGHLNEIAEREFAGRLLDVLASAQRREVQ